MDHARGDAHLTSDDINEETDMVRYALLGALALATTIRTAAAFDAQQILVLSDADMAATAYADGRLHPMPDRRDTLAVITPAAPGAGGLAQAGRVDLPAPNSVMGWPGSMDVSPDERYAYIVEVRGNAPAGVEALASIEEMPRGDALTIVELRSAEGPRVLDTVRLPYPPQSIQVAPNGRFLLVSTTDPRADLLIVPIREDGRTGEPVVLDVDTGVSDTGSPVAVTSARLAPDGRGVALNVGNTELRFLRLDAADIPRTVTVAGAPLRLGRWLSMMRWSDDSRFLVVADTGWGPDPLDAALNGAGTLYSVAVGANGATLVSRARVSRSPEAFELSPDGRLIAVANMERTYLPDALPFSLFGLFGERSASSLSLVAFDPQTGALQTLGRALPFRGVLPEKVAFDRSGRNVAVVVYQDHGQPTSEGWITTFALDGSGPDIVARETGERISVPRGAHDLVVLDGR